MALLAEIRFACGDNGRRMQPELVEFIRELALNSARYLYLRDGSPDDGPEWERAHEALWHAADGRELDHAIDSAMGQAAAGRQGARVMTRNVAMVVKQAAFGECDTRTWEWLVHKGFARKEGGSFHVIQAAAEQSARVLDHQQDGRRNG